MLRSILIPALLAATPAVAQSDDQEARFYEAIRAVEAQTYAYYVSVDPRFAPLLAPVAEDPAYRENQRCVLARIEAGGGSDVLEEYIAAMEVQGETEITSLIALANDLPEVLMSDLVFAAATECGAMSHSTARMMMPEFMELMEEPEVMQGLMGQ